MILDINDKINSNKIDELKKKMIEEVGEIKYKTWLRYPLSNYKIKDGILILKFESYFYQEIFEKRYLELIKENIDFEIKIDE